VPDAKDIRFLGGVLFPGLASRHSRTAPVAPSDDSTTRSIALIVTAWPGRTICDGPTTVEQLSHLWIAVGLKKVCRGLHAPHNCTSHDPKNALW
jgi:hypothetical protein